MGSHAHHVCRAQHLPRRIIRGERGTKQRLGVVSSRLGNMVAAAATAATRLGALTAACLACRVQVIKQPDDALLAFLLGNAIGVMFLLSVAEM